MSLARRVLPKPLFRRLRALSRLRRRVMMHDDNWRASLRQEFADVAAPPAPDAALVPWERSIRSPGGEDGILLNLFQRIGPGTRTFLDVGCANGRDSNCATLALDFGWSGLMADANAAAVASARRFFGQQPGARVDVRHEPATPGNIAALAESAAGGGELSLLSLDIDGNDYHVFAALPEQRAPRVAVLEYNASCGPVRRVTVSYVEEFDRHAFGSNAWYHGASLAALTKTATEKGMSLIGCDSRGTNGVFVRDDLLAATRLPRLTPEQAWRPSAFRAATPIEAQWDAVKHHPWQDV
jgi:hypothetical protein